MMEEFEEIEKIKISSFQENVIEENAEEEKIEEKLLTSQKKKPDYKVLQPDVDVNGKRILKNVGAMWKAETKDGKEYYVMKIGELRLLVFPNK